MVLWVRAGLDRGVDDVVRGGKVGFAGAEPDDRASRSPELLGFGVDCQGGRLGDGTHPGRDTRTSRGGIGHGAPHLNAARSWPGSRPWSPVGTAGTGSPRRARR